MAKSVMQTEKECFFCGTTLDLEEHHCLFGFANRQLSEKYGLKVWLCGADHRGNNGVHFNRDKNLYLKRKAQERFEELHGDRAKFIRVFGKNYLD